MVVYLVTNLINSKVYVGRTVHSSSHRWKCHVYQAIKNGSKTRLSLAIRKYGVANFRVEDLCEATSIEELEELEKESITKLSANNPMVGYNLTEGGDGSEHFSLKHKKVLSTSHKVALSIASSGRKHSEEAKAKMRGRIVSDETRRKLSQASAGRELSLESRAQISRARTGRVTSPEVRKKISEKLKGRENGPLPFETREKISKTLMGRQFPRMKGTKLNRFQAEQIRSDSRTYAVIASEYGISVGLISMIKTGKTWKEVHAAAKETTT